MRLWDLQLRDQSRAGAVPGLGHRGRIVRRWALDRPGGRDGRLLVWEVPDNEPVAAFYADAGIRACAVTPDGQTIVAGDFAGAVHLLKLERGIPPAATGVI